MPGQGGPRSRGEGYPVREAWRVLRLALRAPRDPGPFCHAVAAGSVQYLRGRGVELAGRRILDAGSGFGALSSALAAEGAHVIALDIRRTPNVGGVPFVMGRVERLPFADGTFDGVVSSNVLEHVSRPGAVLAELARVTRSGGFLYVSWTPWLSPLGGHELSPFHYLGPGLGLRAYRLVRRREPPWNVPGRNLFPVHVGRMLRSAPRAGLRVRDAAPRYWPSLRWLARVPGLREVAMWNCVLLLERPGESGDRRALAAVTPTSAGSSPAAREGTAPAS